MGNIWRARQAKPTGSPSFAWQEHLDKIDPDRLASYLEHYPRSVRDLVEAGA